MELAYTITNPTHKIALQFLFDSVPHSDGITEAITNTEQLFLKYLPIEHVEIESKFGTFDIHPDSPILHKLGKRITTEIIRKGSSKHQTYTFKPQTPIVLFDLLKYILDERAKMDSDMTYLGLFYI